MPVLSWSPWQPAGSSSDGRRYDAFTPWRTRPARSATSSGPAPGQRQPLDTGRRSVGNGLALGAGARNPFFRHQLNPITPVLSYGILEPGVIKMAGVTDKNLNPRP